MCIDTEIYFKKKRKKEKSFSSKTFEDFFVLNLAVFFLAELEENLAVIYFLLLLRGAIGTARLWVDWEKPVEERGALDLLGAKDVPC